MDCPNRNDLYVERRMCNKKSDGNLFYRFSKYSIVYATAVLCCNENLMIRFVRWLHKLAALLLTGAFVREGGA